MEVQTIFQGDLNCFVLWEIFFIGTGKLLNTLIPVYVSLQHTKCTFTAKSRVKKTILMRLVLNWWFLPVLWYKFCSPFWIRNPTQSLHTFVEHSTQKKLTLFWMCKACPSIAKGLCFSLVNRWGKQQVNPLLPSSEIFAQKRMECQKFCDWGARNS
jgi:hypothetical protein